MQRVMVTLLPVCPFVVVVGGGGGQRFFERIYMHVCGCVSLWVGRGERDRTRVGKKTGFAEFHADFARCGSFDKQQGRMLERVCGYILHEAG